MYKRMQRNLSTYYKIQQRYNKSSRLYKQSEIFVLRRERCTQSIVYLRYLKLVADPKLFASYLIKF